MPRLTYRDMGHIIGPGRYELDVIVAAAMAKPITKTVPIYLPDP